MAGFFQSARTATRTPLRLIADCNKCGFYKKCRSPKMKSTGKGRRKILIVGDRPGCISGDSLIEVAFRDKSKYPEGIPIKKLVGQDNLFVYSFSILNQEMEICKVKKVWRTGRKRVYKVTYEWKYVNGDSLVYLRNSIKVTSNHKFLLKRHLSHDPFKGRVRQKSEYRSIDEGLQEGDSIQPFLRITRFGYSLIGASSRKMNKESRLLLSYKLGRDLVKNEECHHVNENKLDDTYGNLESHSKSNHAKLHYNNRRPLDSEKARLNHRKAVDSEEWRDANRKRMKKLLQNPEVRKQWIERIHEQAPRTSETLKNKYRTDPVFYYNYLLGRKKCIRSMTDAHIQRLFKKRFPRESFPPIENHKIISIEYVGTEDVYDMEVEKNHNFAVNGIFVHNSMEDMQGKQFVGGVGRYLADVIRKVGYDMRDDCTLTNALICFHPNNKANLAAVSHCQPNLIATVNKLQPDVIIPLGGLAVKSLLSWVCKEEPGEISKWVGYQIPSQMLNAWICPSWNPSYLLRSHKQQQIDPVLERLFEEHIAGAFALESKPWSKLPDYKRKIQIVYDTNEAARAIDLIEGVKQPVAFDLETNMLKPDSKEARIFSCAISNGEKTVAYLWRGEAIQATQRLLQSDIPKIGYNIKFEERWIWKEFGHGVNNWSKWNADGMINAHILDNRNGITGLKFQAFVMFGIAGYEDEIKPFLESKDRGGNTTNTIFKAPVEKVLLYNGMDALLEYKVHQRQVKGMR